MVGLYLDQSYLLGHLAPCALTMCDDVSMCEYVGGLVLAVIDRLLS